MSHYEPEGPRRVYRDRENGVFLGVCAGVANFFEVRPMGVRLFTLAAMFFFFWPTVLTYLAAGLLFKDKPLRYRGRGGERAFWRRGSDSYEGWR